MEGTGGRGIGAAQRHMQRWAATLCILLRHSTSLLVAAVNFANPGAEVEAQGRWLLLGMGCWALYRLATRSQRPIWTAADVAVTVGVCAALSSIVDDPRFFTTNSAPQAIACAAVATFAIQLAPGLSLPTTLLILGAYTWGAAAVVGWNGIAAVDDIYFFVVQWVTGTLVRFMIWRIAAAVDRARKDREAAEIAEHVAEARRNYDREQLAVLHDTAAATLLLVGQGTVLPPRRLAAQATRDLDLLGQRPWHDSSAPTDLVAALRGAVQHLDLPVIFTGEDKVWVSGQLASAVAAAVREAANNVDRHANATTIHVDVGPHRITVTDNGVGFAHGTVRPGHGTRESILGRMQRAGGTGVIRSSPTEGTVVEMSWLEGCPTAKSTTLIADTERFIRRVQVAYGLAIAGFAVFGLGATVPWGLNSTHHPAIQCALACLTALCAVAAIPVILNKVRWFGWGAALVLATIALLQPGLLSTDMLSSQRNWSLGAIGWCVVPLILGWPPLRAAAVLSAYWVIPGAVDLVRDPSAHMTVYLGLSLASYLIAQVFALTFSTIARQAAHDARAENEARLQVVTKERVAEALQTDYLSRYAEVINRVVPILRALSRSEMTPEIRRQARIESRRLRMLFDHSHAPKHPLLAEIRALAEVAEERGVDVSIDADDDLPAISAAKVREFAMPIALLLAATDRSARIVLTASGGDVTGSVVCDVHSPAILERALTFGNVTNFVCSAGRAWMTVSCDSQDGSGPEPVLMSTA